VSHRRNIPPIIAVVAVLVAAAFALYGGAIWILLIVSAAPWLVILRRRYGTVLALSATWFGGLVVVLATMMMTAATALPMFATVVVVIAAIGTVGCVDWIRHPQLARPHLSRVVVFVPAFAGPIVWLTVSIRTAIISPVAGRAWAMHGDAANYLLFARGITRSGGVVVGQLGNPVPLPSALFALFMAPGRGQVDSAGLLLHDLARYESLQILVIASCCLFAGALAGMLAGATRLGPAVVIGASACGSLLPLSWTLTTNAIAYGYFDAQLALPCVFACLILTRVAEQRPVAVAVTLSVGSTVLLSVWTPLVLVPFAGLVVIAATGWGPISRTRGLSLVALVLGILQLATYAITITLHNFLGLGRFLSAPGAAFTYTHSLFPSLGAMTILLSVLVWRQSGARAAIPTLVLPIALGLGLAFLLFEARASKQAWSYFPSKFEWLSICILLVVALGLLPVVFASILAGRAMHAAAVISVVTMTAIVASSTPEFVSGYDWANPVAWIAQTDNPEGGKAAARRILSAADLQHPRILWQSNVPDEAYIDYWLIEVAARSIDNNALRKFAYAHNDASAQQLCTIVKLIHPEATILTNARSLSREVSSICPGTPMHIVLLNGVSQ